MTTREKLKQRLIDNGMFDSQAEKVMELAIPKIDSLIPGYKITWNRPAEEYPDQIFDLWFSTIKEIALKWINENLPKAWFKPMFE